jgi:diguanylate cyclase (GGDEF)-like protein/PAS domain S-box-containing protein
MTDLHPLLLRQITRLAVDREQLSDPAILRKLLERVSRAYEDHERDRSLLERSQELASQEMASLYATVRADRDLLENRVRERTAALRESEGRLRSLLSLSADWVWERDANLCFTYVSEGRQEATGQPAQALLGQTGFERGGEAESLEGQQAYETSLLARRAFRDLDICQKRSDGSLVYLRISGEPVFDEAGNFTGYRGIGSNVTQARLAEQRVYELARYDSLTGIPNRSMFLGELDRTIAAARFNGSSFAVCFIDLDGFKSINDTLGHGAGDEMLKVMALRLRENLRKSDLVARLGGDEFVVLLEDCDCTDQLVAIAGKLLAAISVPVQVNGRSFLITGSVGIARFRGDGEDAGTLLKHADAAMYLAKDKGKNNIQLYSAELADRAARAFANEAALRLALARDEFRLHYQPKIDMATGAMKSVEALIRWYHPERGIVAPGEFVPLAEACGLIVPIGQWVIREACRQIGAWRRAGFESPAVAVNLSARQFSDESLIEVLVTALAANGVAAQDFEIELTESALMEDPERASRVLRRMNEMGVGISIDDFGTGYSSLSYLKRFPARTVKIDRTFVRGLPDDRDDATITQAVIAMAHTLGLNVVAEGVETAQQFEMLKAMGCDEAQGFLLGRPMGADDLALRLAASTAPTLTQATEAA